MNSAGKFYLGHLGKVPVYVGWEAIFLVMFIWYQCSTLPMDQILIVFAAALLTILLHELGHALVARAAGMLGVTITISSLGGYCTYMPEPRPGAKVLITAAGPLMNFALAGLSWLCLYYQIFTVDLVVSFVFWMFRWNLVLGIFNSMPLYPLDGGQVFHSLAMMTTRSREKANRATLVISVVSAIAILAWRTHNTHGQLDFLLVGLILMLLFTAFANLR